MIDISYATSNLVHDLGCLLLGGECFDGEFASNEGNEIGDRVRLQEAVDGRRELVEAVLLPPRGVGGRLKFWEGGGNVVFPEVNCLGYHAEGGQQVRGCGGIVQSEGTGNDAGYCRVGGIHSGASVTMDGAFKSNHSKNEEFPNPIPEDKTINLIWPITFQEWVKVLEL